MWVEAERAGTVQLGKQKVQQGFITLFKQLNRENEDGREVSRGNQVMQQEIIDENVNKQAKTKKPKPNTK